MLSTQCKGGLLACHDFDRTNSNLFRLEIKWSNNLQTVSAVPVTAGMIIGPVYHLKVVQ